MKSISGIPASYGIAIGPAHVFNRVEIAIEPCNIQEPEAGILAVDSTIPEVVALADGSYIPSRTCANNDQIKFTHSFPQINYPV